MKYRLRLFGELRLGCLLIRIMFIFVCSNLLILLVIVICFCFIRIIGDSD